MRIGTFLVACIIVVSAIGTNNVAAQTISAETAKKMLKVPPDFRIKLAEVVLRDYVIWGRGRPQIVETATQRQPDSPLVLSVCIQYLVRPRPLLVEETTGTVTRSYKMTVYRNMSERLVRNFPSKDDSVSCEGTPKPFPELDQLALKVLECRQRTNGDCGYAMKPNQFPKNGK